jgi:ribonucleoside-diphosphate reductase alpha chain
MNSRNEDLGLKILSSITVFSKYARYMPNLKRRETWDEIVSRYEAMMVKKYPKQKEAIAYSLPFIREKKVLPSMRALQFAGPAAEVNNARIYNCCYLPIDSVYSFSETMFLLLGGTGVGYSVQKHHVKQLPPIKKPTRNRNYLIEDSIMGWADAIKMLMKAYLGEKSMPIFDFRSIREKGARLVTAGGKAPGPEPLKLCLFKIQTILDRKEDGEQLTTLECHDILCHIANSVLAGGIRRSAMISLFSHDDEDMLTCKFGNWYELNEQRGRANNSAVLERDKITEEEFFNIWTRIEASDSGEPGVYWTNDKDWGTNPCVEIALRPFQFCNLVEVNVNNIVDQEDLNSRVAAASYFGTLQAGFTDFHYLRPIWQKTTQKDALIGVSMTGIGSGVVFEYDLTLAAEVAKITNSIVSELIGVNEAARVTCVKPAGTTSLVLETSSGIHAWHAPFYDRIIRFGKNEPQAIYLMENHPEICEDDILRPKDTLCVRIPVKAPKGSIFRTETAIDLLERVKKFSNEWILPGHNNGVNTHNVSATVSIDKNRDYLIRNDDSYYSNITALILNLKNMLMNGKLLVNGCGIIELYIMD